MSFTAISNILDKQMPQKSAFKKQITAAMVCEEFDNWLIARWGDKIKNKAKALYFKDNSLTIASLSSVFAQEIKLHEREILEHLNLKFGINIERIRYLA